MSAPRRPPTAPRLPAPIGLRAHAGSRATSALAGCGRAGAALRAQAGSRIAASLLLALMLTTAVLGGALGNLPAARAADAPTAPSPTSSSLEEGGDTRSSGEGAGLAGAPLIALGAVAAIGTVSALVTLAYVRFTGGPSAPDR